MRQFTLSRVVLLLFSCIAMSGQLQANLAGHWVFDEGSGTNIVDISGQGNHGTPIGMSYANRSELILGTWRS